MGTLEFRLMRRARTAHPVAAGLAEANGSLLDLVDNLLNKGVVVTGELTFGIANVDLVCARLTVLLCAADRILPREAP
jgi:gas vesicle protein GvpA/GvpJ/GvpM family